jgi:hypothetical protein
VEDRVVEVDHERVDGWNARGRCHRYGFRSCARMVANRPNRQRVAPGASPATSHGARAICVGYTPSRRTRAHAADGRRRVGGGDRRSADAVRRDGPAESAPASGDDGGRPVARQPAGSVPRARSAPSPAGGRRTPTRHAPKGPRTTACTPRPTTKRHPSMPRGATGRAAARAGAG